MTARKEDEDFLAHFGKKGMKWGVRNKKQPQGSTAPKKVTTNKSDYKINLKPRTQKVMNGAGIAAGLLVAVGGFSIASIYSRKADTIKAGREARKGNNDNVKKQWAADYGI